MLFLRVDPISPPWFEMFTFFLGLIIGFVGGIAGCYIAFRANRQALRPVQSPNTPASEPARSAGTPVLDQILSGTFRMPEPDQGTSRITELRQNLRVKFLHDENKVNDAIEFERSREPSASEEEWLRAANERWERENR